MMKFYSVLDLQTLQRTKNKRCSRTAEEKYRLKMPSALIEAHLP